MSFRTQNKTFAVCIAGLAAITLTGVSAWLNMFTPAGAFMGLVVRIVSLAVILPPVLLAFNFLCDRCDGEQDTTAQATNQEEHVEPVGLVYRGIPLGGDTTMGSFSTPLKHDGDAHNGDSSGQIVVPVSIHQRSFRTVAAGKKWWVGQ